MQTRRGARNPRLAAERRPGGRHRHPRRTRHFDPQITAAWVSPQAVSLRDRVARLEVKVNVLLTTSLAILLLLLRDLFVA